MIKLKQYKSTDDYSYAIGVYPSLKVIELKSEQVEHVLVGKDYARNSGAKEIIELCERKGISCAVNDYLLQKIAQNDAAHAVTFFKKYPQTVENDCPHVVLVNPTDMGNAGTIIRTMIGFAFHNLVIIRPALDVFSPKVIRASMGEIFQVNIEYFDSFPAYCSKYATYEKYLFVLEQNAKDVDSIKPANSRYSLVFGGEGPGLDKSYSKFGTPVIIPQSQKIDSLNLSIAVGIGLYVLKSTNQLSE